MGYQIQRAGERSIGVSSEPGDGGKWDKGRGETASPVAVEAFTMEGKAQSAAEFWRK